MIEPAPPFANDSPQRAETLRVWGAEAFRERHAAVFASLGEDGNLAAQWWRGREATARSRG